MVMRAAGRLVVLVEIGYSEVVRRKAKIGTARRLLCEGVATHVLLGLCALDTMSLIEGAARAGAQTELSDQSRTSHGLEKTMEEERW